MFCVVSEDDRLNCGVVKVKCDNEWNVIGTFLLRNIYSCSWLRTVWWFRVCGQVTLCFQNGHRAPLIDQLYSLL